MNQEEEEEGQLVDSGVFRVDRSKALEKLRRFQLLDPAMFVLPWIRAAVASQATGVRLRAVLYPGRLEMSFDGKPFCAEELKDPYAALFNPRSSATTRNRNLAMGILAALRLRTKSLTVASGAGPQRCELSLESTAGETVKPVADLGTLTELNVLLRDQGEAARVFAAVWRFVQSDCRLCPIPILLDGKEVARRREPPAGELAVSFAKDAAFGWVSVPADPAESSVLQAYSHGVLVSRFAHQLPSVQVAGVVNDDSFTLNVSQSGVAANPRFHKAIDSVSAAAQSLLLAAMKEQAERLPWLSRFLLRTGLRHHWQDRIDRGSAAEAPGPLDWAAQALRGDVSGLFEGGTAEHAEAVALIRRRARHTVWLRDAGRRLLGDRKKDAADPVLKALWETPLFLGADGTALSLAELETQFRSLGFVPFSKQPLPRGLSMRVVWCLSGQEQAYLAERFGGEDRLRDYVRILEQSPGLGAHPLELAGVSDLLVRSGFEALGAACEVGLSARPAERNARFYSFQAGIPAGFWEVDGPLRFEAAVGRPVPASDGRTLSGEEKRTLSELTALATQAACGLYARLAAEFDPDRTDWHAEAARAHLLDYLLFAAKAAAPEPHAWSLSVPLFRMGRRHVDLLALRRRLDADEIVHVAVQPEALDGAEPVEAVVGEVYTNELLRALLPGVDILSVPGRPGLRLMFRSYKMLPCTAQPALAACVLEIPGGPRGCRVHLLAEQAGPQDRDLVAFPWGEVRAVFDAAPQGIPAQDAAALGLEFITAIIHRFRTFYDEPQHPVRRLLVKAMAACLPPWPGDLTRRRRKHLLELFEHIPMFRGKAGRPLSLNEVVRLLSRGIQTELELSDEESALIERLCPGRSRTSVKAIPPPLPMPHDAGPEVHAVRSGPIPEITTSTSAAAPSVVPGPAPLAEDLVIPAPKAAPKTPPWEDLVIRPGKPPLKASPEPVPSEAPQPEGSAEVAAAQRLLRRLKGKVGSRIAAHLSSRLRLDRSRDGAPLGLEEGGAWALHGQNPLVAAVLEAKLDGQDKAAYLASVAFTAANRLLPDVTDSNDSDFQQVLAEELCQPEAPDPLNL